MVKIVADDKIPFLKGVIEPYASIKYMAGKEIDGRAIANADALLIRTRTKCTDQLLSDTCVRFIGTATIGFDHIDTRYCDAHSIRWVNAPGCNSSSVQQYIAAALLRISREFRFRLRDKTLGIIGAGNVGSKVEKAAAILGMRILVNDPPRERREGDKGFTGIRKLLAESDILTFHVPLNVVGEDRTYHMINEKLLKKVKRGTWLINTSRGEVADSTAVKRALESGRLAGAVLDVWENEPDIDHDLMQRTFISTPHIAGYSTDGKANGTAMIVNEMARFFNLPVEEWHPGVLPEPSSPVIEINCKGIDDEDIIRIAVEHSYNISEDDLRLRFAPADFEIQRGDYPLRREFPAYTIKIINGNKKIKSLLDKLGFKVQN